MQHKGVLQVITKTEANLLLLASRVHNMDILKVRHRATIMVAVVTKVAECTEINKLECKIRCHPLLLLTIMATQFQDMECHPIKGMDHQANQVSEYKVDHLQICMVDLHLRINTLLTVLLHMVNNSNGEWECHLPICNLKQALARITTLELLHKELLELVSLQLINSLMIRAMPLQINNHRRITPNNSRLDYLVGHNPLKLQLS